MKANPLFLVLVFLAGAALYLPSLRAPFVYDDYFHFVENARILHPHSVGDIFKNGRQETRPVYNASLALQAALYGTNPLAAHAINLALHLAAAALFWLLLARVGVPAWIRSVSLLLFVIHPVAVESVAYANSRSGLLAMFFSLLALLVFEKGPGKLFKWGIASLVLAIGSKEDAAGSVLVSMGLIRWLENRGMSWTKKHYAAVGLTSLALPALYLFFTSPHVDTVGSSVAPWWQYAWRQGVYVPLHLSLFLWPWPLTPDRDLPAFAFHPGVAITGWIALFLFAIFAWRNRSTLGAIGFVWALAALLPTHSFVPLLDLQATRHLYVALPGMALVLASLMNAVRSRSTTLAFVISCCLAVFFVWRTHDQVRMWSDPLLLWKRDVAAAPSRWRAWLNYSVELGERGM